MKKSTISPPRAEGLVLEKGKPVGAVVAAIDILEFVGQSAQPPSGGVIARELKLNRSTCFNILRTLTARGLLLFDDPSKSYALGGRIVSLARRALDPQDVADAIKPDMQRVADEFHLPVAAWRVMGGRIILVSRAESDTPVRIHMSLGQRLPLLAGSVGRVVASAMKMDEEEIERHLADVKWHSPVPKERFLREVRQVATRGWATDNGDFFPGMSSVSVPVFDESGRLQLACSATALKGQLSKADSERLAAELGRIASRYRSAGQSEKWNTERRGD
jgi:DNA-binding IclR family transcriptional regulator